ncbi:MAG TPA: DUF4126 domain-containing protein [bacterium]|jgi:hypothetical protein
MDSVQVIFYILMGFSLAATCGLRAFLPLLIIGIAHQAGVITLASGFEWIGSIPAIICFGTASLLEILGDKIPAVDHFLDSGGVIVRPVAGAIAASSLITGMDPLLSLVIGIIMGAGIAGLVHTLKGSLRLVSTALTGGIANPGISLAEDGAVATTGILALIIPWLTAALIILMVGFGGRKIISRIKQRREKLVAS